VTPVRLLPLLMLLRSTATAAPSLDVVVGRAVRENYGAIHACYRKVLAEDRRRGGTLFVQVTLGAGDTVKSAKALRDELGHEAATRCILGWVKGWTIRGAAAAGARTGSEITIPLTFRGAPDQFVVRGEDAREVKLGASTNQNTARVLLHAGSVGGAAASLVLLSTRGRVTLPAVAGDQALYVLSGRGRVARRALTRGRAAWIPPGVAAALSGTLELLLVHVPGGPEQRLLGRKVAPAKSVPKAKANKGRALVCRAPLRRPRFSLAEEHLAAKARLRRSRDRTTLLYVVQGEGVVTRGSATEKVGEGSALYIDGDGAGRASALKLEARKKTVLVRVTVEGSAGRSP
jgi:mannose-6-phosphate isomerase-like protein (cupin superfamily)